MQDEFDKTIDTSKLNWRMIEEEKVFYLGNKPIGGQEYDVVRLLIRKGHSPSHARKLVNKIKEFRP